MCGIAGFNWKCERSAKLMTDSLLHRGPDAEGFYSDENVSLGHRRLSVIDLSNSAAQPMQRDNLVIVFNGEIYNFKEIRTELENSGYLFNTASDTEVVQMAYKKWGHSCVDHFTGMWAFCIYDSDESTLFLSRDRFGEKPLYYYYKDNKFIFASELKAIRVHNLELTISDEALNNYFFQKYIGSDRSIFSDVKKLPPASNLIYSIKTGKLSLYNYYNLEDEVRKASKTSIDERLNFLKTRIEKSVNSQLISDVPVGSFLSGGIDSSLISAILARSHSSFKTFSIGFREKSYDELPFSKLVSEHIKTSHFADYASFDDENILSLIENMDEPFGDSSVIPTYLLSKMTRRHVTVALSGDAADEVFGGYDTYLAHKLSAWIPKPFFGFGKFISQLLPSSDKKVTTAFKVKRFFDNFDNDTIKRHFLWMSTFTGERRSKLLYRFYPDETFVPQIGEFETLTKVQIADVLHYLPGDILKKVDYASMQVSLETRVPFLDHHIVATALSLPSKYKIKRTTTKYFLKQLAAGFLPPVILKRKKRGFTVPVSLWIKNNTAIQNVIKDERYYKHGLINFAYVQNLFLEHISERADYARELWLIFVFNYWYSRNFK